MMNIVNLILARNLPKRRLWAREFLIFISCILLSLLILLFGCLFNVATNVIISNLQGDIETKSTKKAELQHGRVVRESHYSKLQSEFNSSFSYSSYGNLCGAKGGLSEIEDLMKRNLVDSAWKTWDNSCKVMWEKFGVRKSADIMRLYKTLFTPTEQEERDYLEGARIHEEILLKTQRLNKTANSQFQNNELSNLFFGSFAALFFLMFFVRLTFYAVRWSVEQLKSP